MDDYKLIKDRINFIENYNFQEIISKYEISENYIIFIVFKDNDNLLVESFEGLLVDFAYKHKVDAIVKGLRAMTDFDYEFQMAQANYSLAEFETIFIPSSPEYGYLSSSMVKEIHSLGGNVSGLVPSQVMERLNDGK